MARPTKMTPEKIELPSKYLSVFKKQGFYSSELKEIGFNVSDKDKILIDESVNLETRRLKLISILPEYKNKINYAFRNMKLKKETSLRSLVKLRMLGGVKAHCEQNNIFLRSMCTKTLELILGYSIEELMEHLKIEKNEDIQNKEIDHIKPKIYFKFKSIRESSFTECWDLKNLRLISIYDNRSKGIKYCGDNI